MKNRESDGGVGPLDNGPEPTDAPDIDRRAALRNIAALAGTAPAVALLLTPSASRAWGRGGSPCEDDDHHHHCDPGHGGPGHGWGHGWWHDDDGWGHDWGNGWGHGNDDNGWGNGWGNDWGHGWGRGDRGWGRGRDHAWGSGGRSGKPWGRER